MKVFVRQHFKIILVSITALVLASIVFVDGVREAQAAREAWQQASVGFQQQLSAVSSLPFLKIQLDRVQKEWEEVKQEYNISVEGGLVFGLLGRLCKENRLKDVSITLAGSDIGFYQGHLRAKRYNFRIAGPFPAVLRVFQGLESSGVPAELKPLKVKASGTKVVAEGTLVLYSLNPPGRIERVSGQSGKYDPFFDYEIRKAELEQETTTQVPQEQTQPNTTPKSPVSLGQHNVALSSDDNRIPSPAVPTAP
jgi:hypothetical protein